MTAPDSGVWERYGLGRHLPAAVIALAPAAWWARVLHACATEASPEAAFGLAVMAAAPVVLLACRHRTWPARVLAWAATLAVPLTPSAAYATLTWLTGAVA